MTASGVWGPWGPWFRHLAGAGRPRVRLICFPHAGGTAGAYHQWKRLLPADVQALAVRYPGRQDRLGEAPFTAMAPLADAVTAALEGIADGVPTALFGHSMGASVAHEVTLRLRVPPRLLLVSGRRPPHLLREPRVRTDTDEALIADLQEFGEATADVLAHPELRELILPSIRADYSVVATYRPGRLPAGAVPIVAYSGTGDDDAPVADMSGWAELTTTTFAQRTFPGGHFFLQQVTSELVQDVVAQLEREVPAGT